MHGELPMTERESNPKTTNEGFREGLTHLLVEANENNLSVSGRSWECTPDRVDRKWDVEIHLVEISGKSDKR